MFLVRRLKMDVSNIQFSSIYSNIRNKNLSNPKFFQALQNLYLFNFLFLDFPNRNLIFQRITLNILRAYLDNLPLVSTTPYFHFYQNLRIINNHFRMIFILLKFQPKF